MSQDPAVVPAPAPVQHHHVGHNHVPDAAVSALTAAAALARTPLPSLAVHPPGTYSNPQSPANSPPRSPHSPREEDRTVPSAAGTPVVPHSAGSYRRATAPSLLEQSPGSSGTTSTAYKRTASGTLKTLDRHDASPEQNASTAPTTPRAQRQKTDDRAKTSPRNVSQLSNKLRTRLTYALLKVKNDWTSESLEQIESRIRNGQTPASPVSPRLRIKREPSNGDVAVAESRNDAYSHERRHFRTASEPGLLVHPPSNTAVSVHEDTNRTYEAFWRSHEPNSMTKKLLHSKSGTSAPSQSVSDRPCSRGNLQPPAQIIPDRDRRTYNPNRYIPSLHHSASAQSNTSTISYIPNTPPASQTMSSDTQRTMEQDAVESLMFLSSPGHSQQFRQRNGSVQLSQQSSQSRSELLPPTPAPGSQPSPAAPSSQERLSYSRDATTWPSRRRGFQQKRTSLGELGKTNSGIGYDAELTDEEPERPAPEADQYLKPPSQQYVK